MSSPLFDTLLQSVKTRFPKLNWKLGSVIRTLLLEPLTHISEEIAKYSDKVAKTSDIASILNDPYAHVSELDSWISKLSISLPEPSPSTGTVTLITNSDDPITIAAGTTFYWDNSTQVYASDRVSYGASDMSYTEIAPGVYAMEVPVQTSDAGVTFLSSGASLNWDAAPESVQDIYVQSPIGGGVIADAALKAALVSARLTSPSVLGVDSIKAALVNQFNNVICDAVLGEKQYYGGLCTLPIYLKQNYQPAEEVVNIPAKNVYVIADGGAQGLAMDINTEGVVSILGVVTSSGVRIVPSSTQQHGEIGTPGSYCTIITTQFSDPETLLKNIKLQVKVLKLEGAMTACEWLNNSQRGLPYRILAALPAYGNVKMQINTGGANIPRAALTEICSLINNSALNHSISDTQVKTILAAYGVTVNSAILYVATVHHAGAAITTTQTGSLTVYGLTGLGGTPCALYCSINDIQSY